MGKRGCGCHDGYRPRGLGGWCRQGALADRSGMQAGMRAESVDVVAVWVGSKLG